MLILSLLMVAFADKNIICGAGNCTNDFAGPVINKATYSAIDIGNNTENVNVSVPAGVEPRNVRLNIKNGTMAGRNLNINLTTNTATYNAGSTLVIGDVFNTLNVNLDGFSGLSGKDSSQICAERILSGNYGQPIKDAYELRRTQNPSLNPLRCDNVDLNNLQSLNFSCDANFNELTGTVKSVSVSRIKNKAICQAISNREVCLRRKYAVESCSYRRYYTSKQYSGYRTIYSGDNFTAAISGRLEGFEEDVPLSTITGGLSGSAGATYACLNHYDKVAAMQPYLRMNCSQQDDLPNSVWTWFQWNCSTATPGTDPIRVYPGLTSSANGAFGISMPWVSNSSGYYAITRSGTGSYSNITSAGSLNIWTPTANSGSVGYTSPGFDYSNNTLLPGSEWEAYVTGIWEKCLGDEPGQKKYTKVSDISQILSINEDSTTCQNINYPDDPNNRLVWGFSGFSQDPSFGLESYTCTEDDCLTNINVSETDKILDVINPTNGEGASAQGNGLAIIYDAYNVIASANKGTHGAAGKIDLFPNHQDRVCARVQDATSEGMDSEFARNPSIVYNKFRWKPLNITASATAGHPANTVNHKIEVWKKVDSSVRYLLSKELL